MSGFAAKSSNSCRESSTSAWISAARPMSLETFSKETTAPGRRLFPTPLSPLWLPQSKDNVSGRLLIKPGQTAHEITTGIIIVKWNCSHETGSVNKNLFPPMWQKLGGEPLRGPRGPLKLRLYRQPDWPFCSEEYTKSLCSCPPMVTH